MTVSNAGDASGLEGGRQQQDTLSPPTFDDTIQPLTSIYDSRGKEGPHWLHRSPSFGIQIMHDLSGARHKRIKGGIKGPLACGTAHEVPGKILCIVPLTRSASRSGMPSSLKKVPTVDFPMAIEPVRPRTKGRPALPLRRAPPPSSIW